MMRSKTFKNSEKYSEFYSQFESFLKKDYKDYENREKLIELIRFHTTKLNKMISFPEYVTNMDKDQKSIYFITGADKYVEKLSFIRNV